MKPSLILLLVSIGINSFGQSSLRSLILSCNVPAITPPKPASVSKVTNNEPDENGVMRPCHQETWTEVTAFDELISLNPNNNTVWPGAAIQGKSLQTGTLDLISLKRSSGRITVTGLNFPDGKPNYADVSQVSESKVKEAIRKLITRPSPTTDASFSYSSSEVFSSTHALQSIGLAANWAWGSFGAQLSSSNFSNKHVFVVKLTQKYYSISFSDPQAPEAIFKHNVKVDDAKLYMSAGNPPAMINNVNYGRIILLVLETSESADAFKTALNASFNGWGASGSANFANEQSVLIQNSDIKIFAIGGDAKQVSGVITAGEGKSKLDKLKEYIEKGAEFSATSTGVPIGYKAIYLTDNHVASINSTSTFSKVYCEMLPYRKPLKVTLDKLVLRDVTDDDEDMQFAYSVQFLGQAGNVLDEFGNHKPITYVEEPGKVGEKSGVNAFFQGENKTLNQPVFSVKCTVWAKSDDGDCEKPWGTGGAAVERVFNAADFQNTSVFRAWDCIDLFIRFD